MLIAEKRRARALYHQRTRLSSHKSKYNNLASSLKRTLSKIKALYENYLKKLSIKGGSLLKVTKQALQFKATTPPLVVLLLQTQKKWNYLKITCLIHFNPT